MGETRQFTRPASPTPSDITSQPVSLRTWWAEAFMLLTQFCHRAGEVGLMSTFHDFTLLGPQNYEINLSSFVANQAIAGDFSGLFVVCRLH